LLFCDEAPLVLIFSALQMSGPSSFNGRRLWISLYVRIIVASTAS
jgi:hypothetical protein